MRSDSPEAFQLREHTLGLVRGYLLEHDDERERLGPLLDHLAAPGDVFTRANVTAHMTSSALVLSPDRTEVLVIHHRFLGLWLQPGGHYEPPGSLWDSARREVAEETGVDDLDLHPRFVESGLPLDIDSHPIPDRPARGEPGHFHHDLCFLAVARTRSALDAQFEEVHGARWVPVDDLAMMTNRRMARLGRKLVALA